MQRATAGTPTSFPPGTRYDIMHPSIHTAATKLESQWSQKSSRVDKYYAWGVEPTLGALLLFDTCQCVHVTVHISDNILGIRAYTHYWEVEIRCRLCHSR